MDIKQFKKVLFVGEANNGVRTLLTPVSAALTELGYELVSSRVCNWDQFWVQIGYRDAYPGIATFRSSRDEHVTGHYADMEEIIRIAGEHGFAIAHMPRGNTVPQSNQREGETPSPTPEEFLKLLGIEPPETLGFALDMAATTEA